MNVNVNCIRENVTHEIEFYLLELNKWTCADL